MKAYLYRLCQQCYALWLSVLKLLVGVDGAKKFDAKLRYNRSLNLKEPKTLADKVSYISLHGLGELESKCTDKWEVRAYVKSKELQDILIPVYGNPVEREEDLDFNALPERFIVKATHGCKMNYTCANRNEFDSKDCRKQVALWLKSTYGKFSMESHYKDIPHRVYCEKLIDNRPTDYKFFCYNGEPSVVLVCNSRDNTIGQASKVEMKLYDMQWNPVDGLHNFRGHIRSSDEQPKPVCFKQMIEIAKTLAKDFCFVRVDLYEVDQKIYFGELTFTPANTVFSSYTDEFLTLEGEKLDISQFK